MEELFMLKQMVVPKSFMQLKKSMLLVSEKIQRLAVRL